MQRRNWDEIAKQLRVSTRTVKRRLNLMMKGSAIFTMPIVDLGKTEGVSYQLRVESERGRKSEVEKSVSSLIKNVIFRANDSGNGSIFGFAAANISQGTDILELVKRQPGVKSATLTIIERIVQGFDWIQKEVESRVKAESMIAVRG